ncbi:MAG: hypothetical protein K9H62_24185 [Bacteroidales bacterium]|nr:hypothetical protein [Bacteroidales bacterium]
MKAVLEMGFKQLADLAKGGYLTMYFFLFPNNCFVAIRAMFAYLAPPPHCNYFSFKINFRIREK